MSKIIKATATCTGGGIYIYTGQLDDGRFFMTNDDIVMCMYVDFFDSDPYEDFDDSCNEIWQNEHRSGNELSGIDALNFTKDILRWIIKNKPEGNYSISEIESRLSRL